MHTHPQLLTCATLAHHVEDHVAFDHVTAVELNRQIHKIVQARVPDQSNFPDQSSQVNKKRYVFFEHKTT